MRRTFLLTAPLTLVLLFGAVSPAFAYVRGAGNEKFFYSKRRIDQRLQQRTGTGGTTFDRRAQSLRETAQQRFQNAVENRKFTGERRSTPVVEDKTGRTIPGALRRIDRARAQGGIRLRSGSSTIRQLGNFNSAEKAEQIRKYREAVKARETSRYQMQGYNEDDCAMLTGVRQARCWYKQRADVQN